MNQVKGMDNFAINLLKKSCFLQNEVLFVKITSSILVNVLLLFLNDDSTCWLDSTSGPKKLEQCH